MIQSLLNVFTDTDAPAREPSGLVGVKETGLFIDLVARIIVTRTAAWRLANNE